MTDRQAKQLSLSRLKDKDFVHRYFVSLAVEAAELVLPVFELRHPNDKRPRKAVEAAKRWILDPSKKNADAADAAGSKAVSAAWSAAGASASAAAYAAHAAADAANAAWDASASAAAYAAHAVADAAAAAAHTSAHAAAAAYYTTSAIGYRLKSISLEISYLKEICLINNPVNRNNL